MFFILLMRYYLQFSQIMMTEKEILEVIKSVFIIALHIVYFTLGNYAGQEFINRDTHFYHSM